MPAPTSRDGLSSSKTRNKKSFCRRKNAQKGPFPFRNGGQPTSTKDKVKKRRVTKMGIKTNKLRKTTSRKQRQGQLDFSIYFPTLLKKPHSDLIIVQKVVSKINIYLNRIFERLVTTSATILVGKKGKLLTDEDIEAAVLRIVDGELAKKCVKEGRKAVEKERIHSKV